MDEQNPGIDLRVRAARARLGWTREALAFHSGVSWSAITQVETGRRRDLRSGTLAALAAALGVTTDYLVLGRPGAVTCGDHRLLRYRSDDELLATVAPFLAGASQHSEGALAVTSERTSGLLRRALGDAAEGVRFGKSSSWHASPMAALHAYEEFCASRLAEGAPWVRIVAEQRWTQLAVSEARAWIRLEALLSLVLVSLPVSLLCICEDGSPPPAVDRSLSIVHSHVINPGAAPQEDSHVDPRSLLLER